MSSASLLRRSIRRDLQALSGSIARPMGAAAIAGLALLLAGTADAAPAPDARAVGLTLTEADRAFLAAHPRIRYGLMGTDWSPVEIVAPDGKTTGITPDFRDRIAHALGIEFEIVRAANWQALEDQLRRREVDVTGSLADVPERRGFLSVTSPYLSADLGIVTRLDAPGRTTLARLAGRRVAMEVGYANTVWLREHLPSAEIIEVVDTPAALRAVAEGRAEAHLGNVLIDTHLIQRLLLTNLRVTGTSDAFPMHLHFGVRNDWPELLDLLNRALAAIPAAERDDIRDRWVAAPVVTVFDWTPVLHFGLPAGIVVLAALAFVVVWNRRLQREIGRRRDAQAALAGQTAFLGTLLEALPNPVVVKDAAGRYLMCNRAYEQFYGVDRSSMLGRTVEEATHLAPERRAAIVALDRPVLEGGGARSGRLRSLRADGADREVLYSLSAFAGADGGIGGVVGVIVDVTELETAREQARTAAALLRDITDAAPGVVWRYISRQGERGWFDFVSAGVGPLHGIAPDRVLRDPREVFSHVVEEDRPALIAHVNTPWSPTPVPWDHEYRVRLPDGRVRWVSVQAQPRLQPDGSVFWDGTAFDVTVQKELQAALAAARARADQATKDKSRFLATISHEIRTPLAGMLGMLALLRTDDAGADRDRLMGLTHDAAGRLLRVLNDLLDFSKLEVGQLQLERSAFDLDATVGAAVELARSAVNAAPVAVRIVRDPAVPAWVLGDPLRLRQVLDNLLSNAVRFTARGEIAVRVTADGPGLVRFEVNDTGVGFGAEQRARIFEPYEQGDAGTARRFGGTGLGLTISRDLVALQGGVLDAEGVPGQGARFWFTLPLPADTERTGIATAPPMPEARWRPPTPEAAAAAGAVVLTADDDDLYREVVTLQLSRLGVVVETCRNGAEALAALQHDRGRYGLLVTDGHMPVLDGFALVRLLESTQDPAGPLPVLMLSATSALTEAGMVQIPGLREFLTKPVPLAVMDDALRRLAPHVVEQRSVDDGVPPTGAAESGAEPGTLDFDPVALVDLLGTAEPALLARFSQGAVNALAPTGARLREAVAARDSTRVQQIAHATKGSAASAGAQSLVALMAEFTRAAESTDWTGLARLCDRMDEAYAAFAAAVRDAWPVEPTSPRK